MKKALSGLALLVPLAGLVHAQSDVTLAGTVDGGVRYQTNANAAGGSLLTSSSNGYYSSNKLDFIGHEQIDDSTRVVFLLESGFNLANGQLDNTTNILFNRQAYLQLEGDAGAISLGRQYTISHGLILEFDPFGFHYTPLIPLTRASDGTRFNNDLKYSKYFGPLRIEVENAFGGVAGSAHKGTARGVGVMYEAGDLTVGVELNRQSILVGTNYHDDNYYLVGAAYTIGALKISGGFMTEAVVNVAPLPETKTRNSFGGFNYSISPALTLTAGYYLTASEQDKAQRSGLAIAGLDYALSKRTRLFVESDFTHYGRASVSTINVNGAPHQAGFTTGMDIRF